MYIHELVNTLRARRAGDPKLRSALLIALSAFASTSAQEIPHALPAAMTVRRPDEHGAAVWHMTDGPEIHEPALAPPVAPEMPASRGLTWETALPTHAALRPAFLRAGPDVTNTGPCLLG